jgi:hypothetical protein
MNLLAPSPIFPEVGYSKFGALIFSHQHHRMLRWQISKKLFLIEALPCCNNSLKYGCDVDFLNQRMLYDVGMVVFVVYRNCDLNERKKGPRGSLDTKAELVTKSLVVYAIPKKKCMQS